MNPRLAWNDLRVAFALLTRLPLPHPEYDPEQARPMARAAWAYPLVGLVVGVLAALIGWVLHEPLNVPTGIAAALMLLALIMLTGAMHEDGLADCADGFWGAWQPARRLEIMKDSQIGSYGTIALILSLLLRWYCMTLLLDFGWIVGPMIIAAMLSRAAMVVVMQILPNARTGGLSDQTGRPGSSAMLCALALTTPVFFWVSWAALFSTCAVVAVMTAICAITAKRKIGGQTGDVLGATQQVSEIAVLVVIVAAMLP